MARLTKKQLEERLEAEETKIDERFTEALQALCKKYKRGLSPKIGAFSAGEAPQIQLEVKRL